MVEYVKFSPQEKMYGYKNLLYTQIELINSLNHLQTFRSLRKKEMTLKVSLKSKSKELQELIKLINSSLPESHLMKPSPFEEFTLESDKTELEIQLDAIKRKLSFLQMG